MPSSRTPCRPAGEAAPRLVPKMCGADFELGNFFTGVPSNHGTGYQASRALLRELRGFRGTSDDRPAVPRATTIAPVYSAPGMPEAADDEPDGDSQDWGRLFLLNGGCAYIDLNHLELCPPEVLSAHEHVAYTRALLDMACGASSAVNARLPAGQRVHVAANNSDGQGNSYGSHLNFLLHRQTWDNILHRRIRYQAYLAAYQASSIVFTGQGKVGSENGAPDVAYQLSQRADFLEMLCGPQTTFRRPIINSRDEALCGSWRSRLDDPSTRDLARLHVIFYDQNLCQVAGLLKVGVMQIILTMLEAGMVNADLLLDDPVRAVVTWSHDPLLGRRARLFSGEEISAVDLQLRFFEEAQAFVATGACEGIVPDAADILALWGDTLHKLKASKFGELAPRLDWVLKLSILHQVQRQHAGLDWSSPGIRHLDHLYASLDPADGLYLAWERSGLVQKLIPAAEVERCAHNPPTTTRAWTRSAVLLRAQPDEIEEIDWDCIRFSLAGRNGTAAPRRHFTLNLADPLHWTRDEVAPRLEGAASLRHALTSLSAVETAPPARTTGWIAAGGEIWLSAPSSALPSTAFMPRSIGDKTSN